MQRGIAAVNKTLELLIKAMPFLSVLFILFGMIMAVAGAINHNGQTVILSFFIILQSVLALTYAKLFQKIWQK
ncbi:hypothetical protein B4135_4046 [Caldibacillus debilis]|jgi:hypothetical protein|uniref:Uncharacterized protein n=1 Tax=Caldibacillus debilis TaxID=301148 RepID=A0A150L7T7_9BACI|nr:hypothetical protein B4135_4046 [Caldibacillus debilis]MBO2483041.1 hypothetical protein [Bacillaceae bacterium]